MRRFVPLLLAVSAGAQDPPAPSTDRVGFPEGYRERYQGDPVVAYALP